MPRTYQPYSPEYRRLIIELTRTGRSIRESACEFEPIIEIIRQRASKPHWRMVG